MSISGHKLIGLTGVLTLLAALLTGMVAAPATAAGNKVGPARFPGSVTCSYTGTTLTKVQAPAPRVSMDKSLYPTYRLQYVAVQAVLLGEVDGHWRVAARHPGARQTKVSVLTRIGQMRSVLDKRHRKLLTFGAGQLKASYAAFRVRITLQWYGPSSHWPPPVRGHITRVLATYTTPRGQATSCARQLPPPPPHVVSIDAGDAFACALMSDQTVRCWGSGAYGELGTGTTADQLRPVAVPGLSGVTALAVGNRTVCVALRSGAAKCWGYNADGEVGDGTTTERLSPVTVAGLSDVRAIYSAFDSTCATAGAALQLSCWGHDNLGQVGDKGPASVLRPKAVGMGNVISASTGSHNGCAVLSNGPAYCWGSNQWGELGSNATSTAVAGPTNIAGIAGASVVATGTGHACIIGINAGVACWGAGGQGQLGNAALKDSAAGVNPHGLTSGVTSLSAYGNSTCAVLGGNVLCWGGNPYGELGSGDTATFTVPHQAAGVTGAAGVAVGGQSAYAWDGAGHVWAWGDNGSGELATGDVVTHHAPVPVSIH